MTVVKIKINFMNIYFNYILAYNIHQMKKYIISNKNLKGGSTSLIQFINDSTFDNIKINLLDLMYNNKYCPKVVGEGYIGKVYIPGVSQTEKIVLNSSEEITLPVVIKETKILDGTINFDIFNNKLYISGNDNLTTEALILLYTNELWNNKKKSSLVIHGWLQFLFKY